MKVIKQDVYDNKRKESKTNNSSIAPQQTGASFVNSVASALNKVQQTATKVTKVTTVVTPTSTTQKKTEVHYQSAINTLDTFTAYIDNVNTYLSDAIEHLKKGIVVNDTTPFADKANTIKTDLGNLRNTLKTEIIPELSKSR